MAIRRLAARESAFYILNSGTMSGFQSSISGRFVNNRRINTGSPSTTHTIMHTTYYVHSSSLYSTSASNLGSETPFLYCSP